MINNNCSWLITVIYIDDKYLFKKLYFQSIYILYWDFCLMSSISYPSVKDNTIGADRG